METENRLHPRAKIRWPAVIQTSTTLVEGQTQNLSLGGAFIQLSEQLQLSQSLPVVLEARGRKLPCTVEVVWLDTHTPYSQDKSSGIGVRFTRMMLHDREFLHDEISGYLKAGKAAYIGEKKNRMISWPLAKLMEKDKIDFPPEALGSVRVVTIIFPGQQMRSLFSAGSATANILWMSVSGHRMGVSC